jgi:hypothetical protein
MVRVIFKMSFAAAMTEKLSRGQLLPREVEDSYQRTNADQDLEELIIRLSGDSTEDTLAELECADVDSFLSLLAKQIQ